MVTMALVVLAYRPLAWAQLHVFRVQDGRVVEHWAVRDDFAMLEQINQAGA
jgi:predicted SnoaL-like aldol condensation-catalyzing enzyme